VPYRQQLKYILSVARTNEFRLPASEPSRTQMSGCALVYLERHNARFAVAAGQPGTA
jgi:hypothetical protein